MKKLLILLLALGLCTTASACVFLETDSSENSSNTVTSGSATESSIKVTFRQSGCQDIVKTVKEGETLTDIPSPASKTGYTVAWDTLDFSNIFEDITVNAIETANEYTITYNLNGGTLETTSLVGRM